MNDTYSINLTAPNPRVKIMGTPVPMSAPPLVIGGCAFGAMVAMLNVITFRLEGPPFDLGLGATLASLFHALSPVLTALLAAAIANFAVEMGVPTLFLTVPDLLDMLRFSFDSEDTTFEARFNEIRNASLLVLDDFGTQNATGWAQEKLTFKRADATRLLSAATGIYIFPSFPSATFPLIKCDS